MLALSDYGESFLEGHVPVMVPDGEGEFVEAYTTVSGLLAPQKDEFFVPGVEEAVHFYVEYLPSELSRVAAATGQIFFSLLHVTDHTFP